MLDVPKRGQFALTWEHNARAIVNLSVLIIVGFLLLFQVVMSSRFIHSFSGCFLFIKIISLYVHSYQVHSLLNSAVLFIITCCFILFLHHSLYQPNSK
jgi:uncharacterized membrane protein HdeD (DUF308 family)